MLKKILKFLQNVIIGVSIGMIMIIFILNLLMINHIKTKLSYIYTGIDTISYYISQLENTIKNKTINDIKKDTQTLKILDDLIAEDKLIYYQIDNIIDSIKILKEQIERQPSEIEQIENNLKQAVVMIENITQGYQGSGIFIKYNNNYYILTVNHLIEENTDEIYVSENNEPLFKLILIKTDKTKDLALFKINGIPQYYVELADKELEKGNPIYVNGNPLGIEDVLCEGRTLKNTGLYTYFIDHSYFGSSGGGIFTKEGKLLGIISRIEVTQILPNIPPFVINGAIRLNMIKDFLGEIK